MKPKSIKDFEKTANEAKEIYIKQKINFGWNFTEKHEDFEETLSYTIVNPHSATRILFNKEYNMIIVREMLISDMREIIKIADSLKRE